MGVPSVKICARKIVPSKAEAGIFLFIIPFFLPFNDFWGGRGGAFG